MAVQLSAEGLDHPTRARIYEHLLLQPGNHLRSIVRHMRIGFGTTLHHLNVLVQDGLIRTEKGNGRRRYYAIGQRSEPQRNHLYERHWEFRDLRMRVLLVMRRLPEATPTSIARTLGISRQLAAYHLHRLSEIGLARREGRRFRPR